MAENNGKNWEEYQAINNQIQAIQAQRQQNLGEAKAYGMAMNNMNNVVAQGSGVMLDAISPAQFNPQTQNILGKYGVNKPQTIRNQNTQRVGGNTTIINNNTTNNYSSDYGGPVQGRALAFKQQQDNGVGKFKLWLDNLFAKQKEETARRDRDYERRERSLQKESGKLGRKLEGLGSTIGRALDPRRGGADFAGQLKQLLMIFGIGTLAKNFDRVLNGIDKMVDALSYFSKGEKEQSKFKADLVSLLGGKEGETPLTALHELIVGDQGLLGLIKARVDEFFTDRAEAINKLSPPEINFSEEGLTNAFKFLKELTYCIFGGTKGTVRYTTTKLKQETVSDSKNSTNDIVTESKFITKNTSGVHTKGILDSLEGKEITKEDINFNGNLKNNQAKIKQAQTLANMYNDSSASEVDTKTFMVGLHRLKDSTNNSGTLVGQDFINSVYQLGMTSDTLSKIPVEKYRLISRDRTQQEILDESTDYVQDKRNKLREFADRFTGWKNNRLIHSLEAKAVESTAEGVFNISGNAALKGSSIANYKNKTYDLIPEDQPLGEGEEYASDEIIPMYRLTPEIIQQIEKDVKFNFNSTDVDSLNKLDLELRKRLGLLKTMSGGELENLPSSEKHKYVTGEAIKSKEYIDSDIEKVNELVKNKEEREKAIDTYFNDPEFSRFGRSKAFIQEKTENVIDSGRKLIFDTWNKGFSHSDLNGFINNKEEIEKKIKEQYSNNPELGNFISKSVKHLVDYGQSESVGRCGAYVANALVAGGAKVPNAGKHGYTFKKWCSEHGYDVLGHWNSYSDFAKDEKNINAMPGDIISVGYSDQHPYGHVTMYSGDNGWISDFRQKTTLGLLHPEEYGDITLFRPTLDTIKSFSANETEDVIPEFTETESNDFSSASPSQYTGLSPQYQYTTDAASFSSTTPFMASVSPSVNKTDSFLRIHGLEESLNTVHLDLDEIKQYLGVQIQVSSKTTDAVYESSEAQVTAELNKVVNDNKGGYWDNRYSFSSNKDVSITTKN